MVVNWKDIEAHVVLYNHMNEGLTLEGKKYKIVGLHPQTTPESQMGRNTLGDLFFLEAPRTFEDLKWRVERYHINVDIALKEE